MAYKVQTDHMGPWNEIVEPFIVPTPKPYIIDLCHHLNDKEQTIAQLLQQVELLREFMTALGISESEGRKLGLTLNGVTSQQLHNMAMTEGKYTLAALILDNRF